MPGPMRYQDFQRIFASFDVHLSRPKRKASHCKMTKRIDGKTHVYIVTVTGEKVDSVYVRKARRRFQLLPEHGVTDAEFNSR